MITLVVEHGSVEKRIFRGKSGESFSAISPNSAITSKRPFPRSSEPPGSWRLLLNYVYLHSVLSRSVGRTGENPSGHGLDRIKDVPEVCEPRRQNQTGCDRTFGLSVHRARAEQRLLRDDRVPPRLGVAAHDELGSATVSRAPGHYTTRAPSRGRVIARTG